MLLTLTTTHQPATDLGFLLRKYPDRPQSFDVGFGTAHVVYPEASPERCMAALIWISIQWRWCVAGVAMAGRGAERADCSPNTSMTGPMPPRLPQRGARPRVWLGHDQPVRGEAGTGDGSLALVARLVPMFLLVREQHRSPELTVADLD